MSEETTMSPTGKPSNGRGAQRGALLALSTLAAIASPYATAVTGGLLVVLLGVALLALVPAAAPGRGSLGARRLWEAATRAAWVSGALAAVLLFVRALGDSERGIEAIATGMALAFVPGVAGLALASLAAAVAFRRMGPAAAAPAPAVAPPSWDLRLGRALFLALVVWFAWVPQSGGGDLPFAPRDWLLHGPTLLLVAGATLALVLLFGRAWKDLAPVALALAGTLAALVGLLQALLGMARVSIALVTAGMQSVATACFVTLVAMALLAAAPAAASGDRTDGARTANSVAYALFPLVSLLLLAIAMVMVMTPMKKPL